MKIGLIVLSSPAHDSPQIESDVWNLGPVESCQASPQALTAAAERILVRDVSFLAIWDARLGRPDSRMLQRITDYPGDVWHAGLLLGQGGSPPLIDAVHPTWMLNRDPESSLAASSWRLSLRACVVSAAVWRQLGGPDAGYGNLEAAALELGHRWLWGGALIRHEPSLLASSIAEVEEVDFVRAEAVKALTDSPLAVDDQFRFLFQRAGRFWASWALGRGLLSLRLAPWQMIPWWRQKAAPATSGRWLEAAHRRPAGDTMNPSSPESRRTSSATRSKVSVLIPTLDRYPYLAVVLEQLRTQTIAPHEVIVIDQTAPEKRRRDWHRDDLPLRVIVRDRPGQSSARNAGLLTVSGDVVLFLDDDVEIEPDLIAGHLDCLDRWRADASCGVTEETHAGPLPEEFRHLRTSDVFPTCNAAVRRDALERSGLFDLAFDHGSRADADLGTRLYLSGALMVLDPSLSVLHHKAPAGGLREHRARVATYAASRKSLVRHLPSVTEIYLAKRYFTAHQAREMLWLRAFGTLKARGTWRRQGAKLLFGLLAMPDTLLRIIGRARRATTMLETYPKIPKTLDAEAAEGAEP